MAFLSVVELGFLIFLTTKTQLSNMFQLAQPWHLYCQPSSTSSLHCDYFVPLNVHQYTHIDLTGKSGFLSFKKKIVLPKLLSSFVHIMKFKYRSDKEAKDKKVEWFGIH